MEQNWKSIWNKREIIQLGKDCSFEEIIRSLLRMDGFDSPTGTIKPEAWINFINELVESLKIKTNESIFEIGCGTGAFLYPFYIQGLKVGGIDFSEKLISNCRDLFCNADLSVENAMNLSFSEKYDYVVSFSVFFYFNDYSIAEEVLHRMYKKARKAILILDIPDIESKESCELMRRGTMSKAEYDKKYLGLQHLYFNKNFFRKQAEILEVADINICQQHIEGYVNNPYRFNVIIKK